MSFGPGLAVLVCLDFSNLAWGLFGMVSTGASLVYFGLQMAGRQHFINKLRAEVENPELAVPANLKIDFRSTEGVLYYQDGQLFFRSYRDRSQEMALSVPMSEVKQISAVRANSAKVLTADGREFTFTTEEKLALADHLNAGLSRYWIKHLVTLDAGNRHN
jgi:hypothetical protein